MKNIFVLAFLIAAFIFCGKSPQNSARPNEADPALQNAPADNPAHDDEEGVLHIPAEKQSAWGLTFHTVRKEKVSSHLSLPGVLELDQNRTAQISSFAEGKIVSLSSDLGSKVRKGQRLVTINSPEYAQTQADFLRARANLNLSRKEYERARLLLEEKAIEEKEFLRRQAENEKSATEFGALGSKLHSFGLDHTQIEALIEKCDSMEKDGYMCEIADPLLPIRTPMSGTVIFRDALVGEHVETSKVLFSVSDLKVLWAHLDAYEEDLPKISAGGHVTIQTDLYPGQNFEGRVTYISDMIDEKLRTAKIRVSVDNPGGRLKPNMYIRGVFEGPETGQSVIVIPEEAVQSLNGEKIVFLRHEEDEFIHRPVRLGEKIDSGRIILEGLEPGEEIVVRGAFSLKSEMGKDSRGHGHAH